MDEEWRDCEDWLGYYQVSNLCRVRKVTGKILKQFKSTGGGYWVVNLTNGNRKKQEFVHRLIAKAFIPNPNNYPIINHKDEDKLNNSIDNLEWCTYSYNTNYGEVNKRRGEAVRKAQLGTHHSEETKKKMSKTAYAQSELKSQIAKNLWQNPEYRKRVLEAKRLSKQRKSISNPLF